MSSTTTKPTSSTSFITSTTSTSKASTVTPISYTSTTSKTSTSTAPATTSASGCTASQWSQCGGIGYSGCKTCAAPYTCKYSNDWYSQCL